MNAILPIMPRPPRRSLRTRAPKKPVGRMWTVTSSVRALGLPRRAVRLYRAVAPPPDVAGKRRQLYLANPFPARLWVICECIHTRLTRLPLHRAGKHVHLWHGPLTECDSRIREILQAWPALPYGGEIAAVRTMLQTTLR